MVADHLPFLHGETAEMVQQEKHKGGHFIFFLSSESFTNHKAASFFSELQALIS